MKGFFDSPSKKQNKVVNFNESDNLVAGDMIKRTYVANMIYLSMERVASGKLVLSCLKIILAISRV